mmetsp:Transcript_5898/g.22415  ORF Transcript_5898/g.22415 Transcript_5898/m.22415 type:complete len:227 (+) Transcript_5898:3175-3855(+)
MPLAVNNRCAASSGLPMAHVTCKALRPEASRCISSSAERSNFSWKRRQASKANHNICGWSAQTGWGLRAMSCSNVRFSASNCSHSAGAKCRCAAAPRRSISMNRAASTEKPPHRRINSTRCHHPLSVATRRAQSLSAPRALSNSRSGDRLKISPEPACNQCAFITFLPHLAEHCVDKALVNSSSAAFGLCAASAASNGVRISRTSILPQPQWSTATSNFTLSYLWL